MVNFNYFANDIWDEYGDPSMRDSFPGGPQNVLIIIFIYLLVVRYIGPRLMKNREPFILSTTLKVFNLINIFINLAYFLYAMYKSNCGLKCFQCDSNKEVFTQKFEQFIFAGGYHYLKIFDLLDTVFFVLRKKDKQVTRLHVVHHAGMPFLTWLAIKFYPYPIMGMTALLNSFVHVLMYTYYYLASVPEYKKYLWWKKYITVAQLVQFIILFAQAVSVMSCVNDKFLKSLTIIPFSFLSYMIYSFSMFYYKTYVKKDSHKSDIDSKPCKNKKVN